MSGTALKTIHICLLVGLLLILVLDSIRDPRLGNLGFNVVMAGLCVSHTWFSWDRKGAAPRPDGDS